MLQGSFSWSIVYLYFWGLFLDKFALGSGAHEGGMRFVQVGACSSGFFEVFSLFVDPFVLDLEPSST